MRKSEKEILEIIKKTEVLIKSTETNLTTIVGYLHYLLSNEAEKVLKCTKKDIRTKIKCNDKSNFYRLFAQASLEVDLALKANTLLESWAREIIRNCKDTKHQKKVWKIALKLAGSESKIKMPHIKEAINTVKGNKKTKQKTPLSTIKKLIIDYRTTKNADIFSLYKALNLDKETEALALKILPSYHRSNNTDRKKIRDSTSVLPCKNVRMNKPKVSTDEF